MINIGILELVDAYIESTPIEKAYVGNQLVWQRGSLPEFIEVDYIENISSAYIDTGVQFSTLSTKYMSIVIDIPANGSTWRAVFGSRWKDGDVDSCLVQLDTKNIWFSKINGTNYRINNINSLGRHVITVQNNMCYVDGTPFTTAKKIPRYSAATMTLLATHNNNNHSLQDVGLKCKIISCEIGNGTTLVRNYVPAYQTTTNKYGLLDKVNNVFYTSPNGTLFTGPSI